MLSRIIETTRRNHALEHATVTILLNRLGPDTRLVGRSTQSGFYIYGDLPTQVLAESVQDGLERLRRGESHLALSPLCGTNLAVAGILARLSSTIPLGNGNRWQRLPNVLLAGMLAVLAAPPVGRL